MFLNFSILRIFKTRFRALILLFIFPLCAHNHYTLAYPFLQLHIFIYTLNIQNSIFYAVSMIIYFSRSCIHCNFCVGGACACVCVWRGIAPTFFVRCFWNWILCKEHVRCSPRSLCAVESIIYVCMMLTHNLRNICLSRIYHLVPFKSLFLKIDDKYPYELGVSLRPKIIIDGKFILTGLNKKTYQIKIFHK